MADLTFSLVHCAACLEGLGDLDIQLDSVCSDHEGPVARHLPQDLLSEEHHREALADNATVMIEAGGRLMPMRSLSFVHGRGRPSRGTRKEKMHVLTNLPRQRFRCWRIRELYRARWGIETMIRDFKITLDGENFHSRSPVGIKQELKVIYLILGIAGLCDVAARIEAGLESDQPLDPYRKDCNRVAILEILAMAISMAATKSACDRCGNALKYIGRRARAKRPGRRFERICKGTNGRWKRFGGKYRRN